MTTPAEPSRVEPAAAGEPANRDAHLPIAGPGEGCLEILSDRIRSSPGVVAIEADFRDSTLTVRYQPSLMGPEQLNLLADEVGAMFAQRVTYCDLRSSPESCAECALRLGQAPPSDEL